MAGFARANRVVTRARWGIMLCLLCLLGLLSSSLYARPVFLLPDNHLQPDQLAVIVNEEDPLSVAIADYYLKARHIPAKNRIAVRLPPGQAVISQHLFETIKAEVDARTPAGIQAYALTWTTPYRVECMSITSAFAFGFARDYCSAERCALTRPSPYFAQASIRPYEDYGLRPTMMIAASDLPHARALIDRGVAADHTRPSGTAYLVTTRDSARSVRKVVFPQVQEILGDWITIVQQESEGIRDKLDVMFYFTGAVHVPYLDTLNFLPGAMADHLTSAGGKLVGNNSQMSALSWLEAGATGSYGTVVEPCNHVQKFPNPGTAMHAYLRGATLIEAYWKSVQQPGEGLFIGEPLARPYGGHEVLQTGNETLLRTRSLLPGLYRVGYAPAMGARFIETPLTVAVAEQQRTFRFRNLPDGVYRLQPVSPAK